MKNKIRWIDKMIAYHLINKLSVTIILGIVEIVSIVLYIQPWTQEKAIIKEILMAVFTSLLVSILVLVTEIYVEYKDNERDQFLEDVHTFGIAGLNQNKEELLGNLLKNCDATIWISGYRLIMTNNLKNDFAQAMERGASGTAVLCAPWTNSFKLVYGTNEKVMNNYFEVFHSISGALKKTDRSFHVYISEKPIFSDTYRIDQNLITGPYMHNTDPEYGRIMAKDFFSYNLSKKSRLYELVENEYITLINEAVSELNWEKFDKAYEIRNNGDFNDEGQMKLFLDCCDPIQTNT